MDSLLLTVRRIGRGDALLAVVCDGVGSLEHGAVASGMAVRMLSEAFGALNDAERVGLTLSDAVLGINAHICREAKTQGISTATTLSALLITNGAYYIVHIGDSRIYGFNGGALTLLTHDDVSDSGRLAACIGRDENISLKYSEDDAVGKCFLLCTDGLYKRMDMEYLTEKLARINKRTLKGLVSALPRYVIEKGEQDNITLAIIKTEG
jgi:serine/threonine protein phosphatase PrpC